MIAIGQREQLLANARAVLQAKTPHAANAIGRLAVLALPKPGAKRFMAGKRISLAQQRVIGLPAPSKG